MVVMESIFSMHSHGQLEYRKNRGKLFVAQNDLLRRG